MARSLRRQVRATTGGLPRSAALIQTAAEKPDTPREQVFLPCEARLAAGEASGRCRLDGSAGAGQVTGRIRRGVTTPLVGGQVAPGLRAGSADPGLLRQVPKDKHP